MSNPVFNENRIEKIAATTGEAMTVSGTIGKTAFLTVLAAATATLSWSSGSLGMPILIAGIIVGLAAVFGSMWKPHLSPMLAPLYAVAEGGVLGVISAMYNVQSHGIVLQAVFITFGILFAMLALFQSRIIKVTDKFRSIVISCTVGIALLYVVSMVLMMFHINLPFLNSGSPMSIGISLFIIAIAAMNFLLDFDNIEKGTEANAPKYYEWVAALGVLVTLVWLYLEVLRLLSNLNRR